MSAIDPFAPVAFTAGVLSNIAADILQHHVAALADTRWGGLLKKAGLTEPDLHERTLAKLKQALALYAERRPEHRIAGVKAFLQEPVVASQLAECILDRSPADPVSLSRALERHLGADGVARVRMKRLGLTAETVVRDFLECWRRVWLEELRPGEVAILLELLDLRDMLDEKREGGGLTRERVLKHLECVATEDTYARWSDNMYIEEKARPLPMNVSLRDRHAIVRIEDLPKEDLIEALERYGSERVVILGDPGAGKTTALERLMWVTAARSLKQANGVVVPIFVALSRYGGETDLHRLLRGSVNRHRVLSLSAEDTEVLLTTMQCLVLLDGLNEMGRHREEGARALANLMDTYPQHRYCLTCRREDYAEYQGEMGDVMELVIQELDEQDVEFYLVTRLGKRKGRSLYRKIIADEQLCSMSRVPLLLYMIKDAGLSGDLPRDRAELIGSFVRSERILGRIRPSAIRSKVQPTLQALGWSMQEQQVTQCAVDLALRIFEECRGQRAYTPESMLDELKKSGLLVPIGDEHLRMLHQMIQDYFAAQALAARRDAEETVLALARDEWWRETLSMYVWLTDDQGLLLRLMRESGAEWQVRQSASEALERIADARLLEPLMTALGDQDWRVRERAAGLLGGIGECRATETLVARLWDEDDYVRRSAAQALVQIGVPAVTALLGTLNSDDADVRRRSAWALGHVGDARALACLQRVASADVSPVVRNVASEATEQIRRE